MKIVRIALEVNTPLEQIRRILRNSPTIVFANFDAANDYQLSQWLTDYERETPEQWPQLCHLCNTQMESADDRCEWHGLGNCVDICERCLGSGEEPKTDSQQVQERSAPLSPLQQIASPAQTLSDYIRDHGDKANLKFIEAQALLIVDRVRMANGGKLRSEAKG